ncbi:DUF4190 domain-containing protein [Blautia producta]|uniref:DUF4190 domain-containing protein n=1 Tax=Blautia producta TaxID=33035 RepID=UPI0031B5DDAA
MYCKSCGSELDSGDKFCRGCGKPVNVDSEEINKDFGTIQQEEGAGMAVASMVCGIVGLLLICAVIGIIPAIVAIVLAANVLKNNKPGKNMAVAGLVTGIIAAGIGGVILML